MIVHGPARETLLRYNMERFLDVVKNTVNCGDVLLARDMLLPERVPAVFREHPAVAALRRTIGQLVAHLDDEDLYKRRYGLAEQAEVVTDSSIVPRKVRGTVAYNYATALPKEGPPLYCLSIGPHTAGIEREMMRANPRIHFTLMETPFKALEELAAEFPGRVHREDPHFGLTPAVLPKDGFHAVLAFEVLEHLPSASLAINLLRGVMADDGVLLTSVPNPLVWQEDIWDRTTQEGWSAHVRAFSAKEFIQLHNRMGFEIDFMLEGACGTFTAKARKAPSHVPDEVHVLLPPNQETIIACQKKAYEVTGPDLLIHFYGPPLVTPDQNAMFRSLRGVSYSLEDAIDPGAPNSIKADTFLRTDRDGLLAIAKAELE